MGFILESNQLANGFASCKQPNLYISTHVKFPGRSCPTMKNVSPTRAFVAKEDMHEEKMKSFASAKCVSSAQRFLPLCHFNEDIQTTQSFIFLCKKKRYGQYNWVFWIFLFFSAARWNYFINMWKCRPVCMTIFYWRLYEITKREERGRGGGLTTRDYFIYGVVYAVNTGGCCYFKNCKAN